MRLASIGERRASIPKIWMSPVVGRQKPRDQTQRRRLSGAVGAEQRVEFASRDRKVEPIDRRPAKALGQGPQHEGGNVVGGHRLLSALNDATESRG